MMHRFIVGRLGALAAVLLVSAASADAIQKWRTPDGVLYFGDRPPAGSTLLETIADSAVPTLVPRAETGTELARAAEEGRDIIRRREAARVEEMKLDAERQAYLDELEASARPPMYETPWLIGSTAPCLPGELCFDDGDRRRRQHRRHDDGLRRIGRGQTHRDGSWRWPGRSGPPLRPLRQAPQRELGGSKTLSPLR